MLRARDNGIRILMKIEIEVSVGELYDKISVLG